jgi:signal transduction histidine kinase
LDRGGRNADVVALFEKGKPRALPADASVRIQGRLEAAMSGRSAQWIEQPRNLLAGDGGVEEWLLQDDPALLFVLPIRVKDEAIGALVFPMNALPETDRAMLGTLGTFYALHVGMTYSMLRATEERRQMQEQLLMQEKMASLGSLVAGVAHEMNNPVGAIQSATDVVSRCMEKVGGLVASGVPVEEIANEDWCKKAVAAMSTNTEVIRVASQRIADMVKSLKNFSRMEEVEYQRANIHEGMDSTLTLLAGEFGERVRVVKEYGAIPEIACFPGQLNQAFMSVLRNAAEAIAGEGTVWVRTERHGETIRIEIQDTGSGIEPEKLKKLFDFDFSRKGSRVKLGLGLPITYSIVQRHKGRIDVESEAGVGSCFTITLPVASSVSP